MKFHGVGSEEADDLGMVDMAEVEAVKSYVHAHRPYTIKQVSKSMQHLHTTMAALENQDKLFLDGRAPALMQHCNSVTAA